MSLVERVDGVESLNTENNPKQSNGESTRMGGKGVVVEPIRNKDLKRMESIHSG